MGGDLGEIWEDRLLNRGTSRSIGPEAERCLEPSGVLGWSRADLYPFRSQEVALSSAELPCTVESVEEAMKRHRDFLTTMELNQQKMQVAVQAAESLLRQGNAYAEQAQEAVARLLEK